MVNFRRRGPILQGVILPATMVRRGLSGLPSATAARPLLPRATFDLVNGLVTRPRDLDLAVRDVLPTLKQDQRTALADLLSTHADRLRATNTSEARTAVDTLRDLSEVSRLSTSFKAGWVRRETGFEGAKSLQTGDVVLVRGVSTQPVFTEVQEVSAGAARSPFSHVGVAWRHPVSNKIYFLESREPVGVQIHEATDALLFDGHARVEVLRPRATTDRAQVQRNVNREWAGVRSRLPIAYDSWLNDHDPTRFNCAQLAAKLLGDGYPAQRTTLGPGMAEYARRAGIENNTVVLPGDFDRDSRFQVIAEGLDPELLRQVRPREAVSRAIFHRRDSPLVGPTVLRPKLLGASVEALVGTLQTVRALGPVNSSVIGAAFDLRTLAAPIERKVLEFQNDLLGREGRVPTREELKGRIMRSLL